MGARAEDLERRINELVIGQSIAAPLSKRVELFESGLAPVGRPAGIFLLLGPPGVGKTRSVEALAEVLHGSSKSLLKIDCVEFQHSHEVAKLKGAPPGYLGHRETPPRISQQKIKEVTSNASNLSLLLFDEIEKAHEDFAQMLLGIFDRAVFTDGSNVVTNFEKTMIFMTSNLGSREMLQAVRGREIGFARPESPTTLDNIGASAVKRHFSPEFVDRIDETVVYKSLEREHLELILASLLEELNQQILSVLGAPKFFEVRMTAEAADSILAQARTESAGARDLRRTFDKFVRQKVAGEMANVPPASVVFIEGSDARLAVKNRREGLADLLEKSIDMVKRKKERE